MSELQDKPQVTPSLRRRRLQFSLLSVFGTILGFAVLFAIVRPRTERPFYFPRPSQIRAMYVRLPAVGAVQVSPAQFAEVRACFAGNTFEPNPKEWIEEPGLDITTIDGSTLRIGTFFVPRGLRAFRVDPGAKYYRTADGASLDPIVRLLLPASSKQ